MVREDDAIALVTDVQLLLAAKGHDPVITDANSVHLVRTAKAMLMWFGIGAERKEDSDG